MKSLTLSAAVAATAVCLTMQTAFGQLVVTPDANANDLASSILGAGITLNSATYTGAANAVGTFTGGNSAGVGLGIDTGIILTSGNAVGAVGPNNTSSYSIGNGTAGSAELSGLIVGQATHDAATLSINFTTATSGGLFFNYVFGSEEYPEFVGAFDDVFGFFLDGNNVALLPSSTTAVSINTVNDVTPANPAYYRNNNQNNTGGVSPFNLQYDGLTTVLSVNVANLAAGTHTIDLGIADALDTALDSGVFIQGGTLSTAPTPVSGAPDAGSTFGLLSLALSAMAMLRRKK